MLTPEDKTALELMIDKSSLDVVLAALADICDEKASHIRSNWQDNATARPWDRAAARLQRLSIHVEV